MGNKIGWRGKAQRLGLGCCRLGELGRRNKHAWDTPQLYIIDVVYTTRCAGPSIGERLDYGMTFGGDLLFQRHRCYPRIGWLAVTTHRCTGPH